MDRQRILYLQYTSPAVYPPLERSSRILAEAGWEVLFLGIRVAGESAKLKLAPHEHVTVRQWNYQPPGVVQKLHYFAFQLWAVATAILWRPRWVYASDIFACPAATILALLGFRVFYHEHDHPGPARGRVGRALARARSAAGRRAALVVVPNEVRLASFVEETGRQGPSLCVWNCPSRAEAMRLPEKSSDELLLFYQGSIVPARVPAALVRALAELPDAVRIQIAGYETLGHPTHVGDLAKLAESLGLGPRFQYLGALSQSELLAHTRRAHVGLSLMPRATEDLNQQTMAGASNKPFEYLACGCALLVADVPEWRELFVAAGFARACDPKDTTSIVQNVAWYYEHRAEMREMGERGRQRVLRDWNYETQFHPVLKMLES